MTKTVQYAVACALALTITWAFGGCAKSIPSRSPQDLQQLLQELTTTPEK